MNRSSLKFIAIAAGVFAVAFIGSGFVTLLLPKLQERGEERQSSSPEVPAEALRPEGLESYKAAQAAVAEYRAAPACTGASVDVLLAKLSELHSDAEATSFIASFAETEPEAYLNAYGATVMAFADAAIAAGCADLAEGRLQELKARLPAANYPDMNLKADEALRRAAAARTGVAPPR